MYQITTRTLKGAACGYLFALVMFKYRPVRKLGLLYGAGLGLGMSYS